MLTEPGDIQPDDPPATPPPRFVFDVWQKLAQSKNGCPKEFDYFPNGGLRNFACHIQSVAAYAVLGRQSGLKIFLSGPHSNGRLVLGSRNSFGHYNPKFVSWAVDNLVPGAHDLTFRAATQPTYNKYVAPLATSFFATYRKIQREPQCFEREKADYVAMLKKGAVPPEYYERYFEFMEEQYCRQRNPPGFMAPAGGTLGGGYNGNVVKTCVAFWIRRSIDGTMPEFYRGLAKLVKAYDPKLYQQGGPSG
jgi:hypothetical protein